MEILAKIKTQADVDALKQARDAYEETRSTLQAMGEDTGEVDAKIAELDDALESTRVRSLQFIDTLEQQAKALRRNGQDTGALEKKISSLRNKLGVKKASFLSRLGGEFAKLVNDVPGASRVMDFFGGVSAKAALKIGLVVVALIKLKDALVVSLRNFAETQDAVIDLDQALANSGQLTDENREKVQALASQFQEATGVADNEWLAALTRIAKLKVPADQFDEYLEAAKNLSAITGEDVPGSVKKLGEALNGSVGELKNLGIEFDANADRAVEMQKMFVQLADRGAGVLESKSKGLAGQWRVLKNQIGDLFKGFGNLLARTGLLQAAIAAVSGAVKVLTFLFPSAIEQVEGMSNKLPDLTLNADSAAASMESLGQSVPDDFGGTAAAEATGEIEEHVDALRRLQAERDQLGDARLQADIAAIDLQEAQAPQTAQNRERFEQARRQVRRAAEVRRLNDEAFVAGQQRETAEAQLADAMANLAAVQQRNTDAIRRAELQRDVARDRAGGEEFVSQFDNARDGQAFFDRQREQLQAQLDAPVDASEFGHEDPIDRAAVERQLEGLESRAAAFAEFVDREQRLRIARETERTEENSATEGVMAAQLAVNAATINDEAIATRRTAFELGSQTADIEARRAAARARLEDTRDAATAQAEALRHEVVNSRDRDIGQAERERAEQQARQFDRQAQRANAALERNANVMVRVAESITQNQEALAQRFQRLEQRLGNVEARSAGNR